MFDPLVSAQVISNAVSPGELCLTPLVLWAEKLFEPSIWWIPVLKAPLDGGRSAWWFFGQNLDKFWKHLDSGDPNLCFIFWICDS